MMIVIIQKFYYLRDPNFKKTQEMNSTEHYYLIQAVKQGNVEYFREILQYR